MWIPTTLSLPPRDMVVQTKLAIATVLPFYTIPLIVYFGPCHTYRIDNVEPPSLAQRAIWRTHIIEILPQIVDLKLVQETKEEWHLEELQGHTKHSKITKCVRATV